MANKYVLLKRISAPGYAHPYSIVATSEDFANIENEIRELIQNGAAVRDFRIMSEIPFEFKCSIELKGCETDG